MSGFTDQQVHLWLEDISSGGYISLHYDVPVLGAAGYSEISGGGYSRVQVPFSQPSNRTIWSLEDAKFTGLLQNQLTHFGVFDAQNQGVLMAYGELPEKTVILNGWGYVIRSGELALSIG